MAGYFNHSRKKSPKHIISCIAATIKLDGHLECALTKYIKSVSDSSKHLAIGIVLCLCNNLKNQMAILNEQVPLWFGTAVACKFLSLVNFKPSNER
jgi:hypothetical protein